MCKEGSGVKRGFDVAMVEGESVNSGLYWRGSVRGSGVLGSRGKERGNTRLVFRSDGGRNVEDSGSRVVDARLEEGA
jgi:hypothetical protein